MRFAYCPREFVSLSGGDVAARTPEGNGRPAAAHDLLAESVARKLLGGPSGIGFKQLNKLRVETMKFSSAQFSGRKGVEYAPIRREADFYAEDLQKLFSYLLPALAKPTRSFVCRSPSPIAMGLAYFLAARLGLALLTKPDGVAVFWPAAGLSAGTLIALGPNVRWPVIAGAMAATIVANLLGDRTVWSAIIFAVCNAGEAVIVAGLVERYFGRAFTLGRLRHVLGLFAAAIVATAISASAER